VHTALMTEYTLPHKISMIPAVEATLQKTPIWQKIAKIR